MDAATLLAGALAGGADRLSPRDCWLCLVYLYAGGATAQVQLEAAIASGCDRLSTGDLKKCLAELLNAGATKTNLIPDGTVYDSVGRYYAQGTDGQGTAGNLLQVGKQYRVTFGDNEGTANDASNGSIYLASDSPFTITYGGSGDLGFYFRSIGNGTPGIPVTATITAV